MVPLRQVPEETVQNRHGVLPFQPTPDTRKPLRSTLLQKADPPSDFPGAFELVARAAEAMEAAERQVRKIRAGAIECFEEIESELSRGRTEAAELMEQLETSQADLKAAELRARESELRARELEIQVATMQQQLAAAETELASCKQWLAYFQSTLAPRFITSSRALEEMGGLSFRGQNASEEKTAKRAQESERS